MNVNEFLSQYEYVCERIRFYKECILRAEHTASDYGGKAEKWSSDYQDRLYGEMEDLIRLRFAIENAVEKCRCSEAERAVLFKRYIQLKKWKDIALEMLYSEQHLHRLKKSALKKVVIPSEWQFDGTSGNSSSIFMYN